MDAAAYTCGVDGTRALHGPITARPRLSVLGVLALVLGLLALTIGHGPIEPERADMAQSPIVALALHEAASAHAGHLSQAGSPADAGCAACGTDHHDAAFACAALLIVVVLLSTAAPRRLAWTLREASPTTRQNVSIRWRAHAPSLHALGISRT